MTTGQLIRQARKAAGLSQNQLGRLLDVTGFLISHWEADRKPVTDMEALASALNTTVEALTGDTEPQSRKPGASTTSTFPLQPMGVESEPFLNISKARLFFQERLQLKVDNTRIHEWVQKQGLPAYENPLRKNPSGEPTLLFLRSQLESWLQGRLRPVHAVNQ